ncbi:HAMP domain-containing protein, partial [Escherichia coli]|uniref:HAMP domain-containing protein n=1 Tax=Escherichia coli TaxID=562 RepID=UPI00200E666B
MMSLWDALRMNMMISYQELVRTFLSVLAILSPLGRLVERARNISNNPLSQSLYTGRTDEFGQIEFA